MPLLWEPQHALLLTRQLGLRPLVTRQPFVWSEPFENGTDGTAVTTANTGFTTVPGAGMTFTTAGVVAGALAMRTNPGAGTNATADAPLVDAQILYVRLYLTMENGYPVGGTVDFCTVRQATSVRARLGMDTSGHLTLRDVNTLVHTSTGTLPSTGPVRIEWRLDHATGGQQATAFWGADLHGSTPTLDTGAQTLTAGSAIDTLRLGHANSATTSPWSTVYDELEVRTDTWPGPTLNPISVPLTDVGGGTDALSVTATPALADTGAGVDALSVSATVPLADTGNGADTATIAATTALTDTGSGADALTVTVPISLTDSGSAVDSLAGTIPKDLTDTGGAADSLSATVAAGLADTGAAADALTVTTAVALTDTASGTDAFSGDPVAAPPHVPVTAVITSTLGTAVLAGNGIGTAVLQTVALATAVLAAQPAGTAVPADTTGGAAVLAGNGLDAAVLTPAAGTATLNTT